MKCIRCGKKIKGEYYTIKIEYMDSIDGFTMKKDDVAHQNCLWGDYILRFKPFTMDIGLDAKHEN